MRNKITTTIKKLAAKNKAEINKVKPSELLIRFESALKDPFWAERDLLRTILR